MSSGGGEVCGESVVVCWMSEVTLCESCVAACCVTDFDCE